MVLKDFSSGTITPDMSEATWQPEWPMRLYERIAALGFHSLSEYIDSRPMVSLIDLARELGPNVAAIQLETSWCREAYKHGRMKQLLGSLLIRQIRDAVPGGWATGDPFVSELADGFASWAWVAKELLPQAERNFVWECLRSLSPPPGWLPVVPHDELTAVVIEAVETALQRATNSAHS